MPHSVTAEDTPTMDTDTIITETEAYKTETQTSENTLKGDSQVSNDADKDMTMADVGVEGDDVTVVKLEIKPELKLEDLFADMDSDDEFPSSTVLQNVKGESSPEAPSSPVYMSLL